MYLVETDRPDPVPILDLKLVVRAGVPLWITWEQKRASTCLRRLEALGHVQVSQGERSREEKKPLPRHGVPSVRLSRPQLRVPPPLPPEEPVAQTYTKAELDAAVASAAAKASQQTAGLFLDQMKALMQQQPAPAAAPGLDSAALEAAVSKALANATHLAPSGNRPTPKAPSRGPEEPLFIPSGIVGNDDTELAIEAESSEDAGLADAAAQLKKLRKRKPR